jgi:predicted PurR-regulated permease PerM
VYGRTIRLNPFVVLLAVVIGVELAGFIGAVVALPVAGVAQVAVEELWGTHLSPSEPAEPAGPSDDA